MADKEVHHHGGGGSGAIIGIVIALILVVVFFLFVGFPGGDSDVNVDVPAPQEATE